MKLTPTEYKLLDGLDSIEGGRLRVSDLKRSVWEIAGHLRNKGQINKREWDKGYVVATATGKRSHARGKS